MGMAEDPHGDITEQLLAWRAGDGAALDRMMPLVYDELRRMARRYLSHERRGHTLQTSALVHEAYLRLVDESRMQWQDRAHFFGVAAQMMRFILVDHARRRLGAKRGGGAVHVTLDEKISGGADPALGVLALDEALAKLAALDPRKSRVAELRIFGGLTPTETAEVLQVSEATITRDWRMARAWLQRALA